MGSGDFASRLALLLLMLIILAGCSGPKTAVGEPCLHDRECDNGFCLELAVIDDSARGRVCTRGCRDAAECRQAAGVDAECRRVGGRSLCFARSWGRR